MAGVLGVSGDIAAAATALSGLLVVFLGSIVASYDGFDPTSKAAVRQRFKDRAKLGAIGFFASLAAAVSALVGKWLDCPWFVVFAFLSLIVSLLVISRAVILMIKDIN